MTRGPHFPRPSPFWQLWASVGIILLLLSFGWTLAAMGHTDPVGGPVIAQMLAGVRRFVLLILTPAVVGLWLGAWWFWRRGLTRVYWQLLAAVAALWVVGAALTHFAGA